MEFVESAVQCPIDHWNRGCQMITQLTHHFLQPLCSGVLCSLLCVRVYTRRPLPLWTPSTGCQSWKFYDSHLQVIFTTKTTSWDLGSLWNDEWDAWVLAIHVTRVSAWGPWEMRDTFCCSVFVTLQLCAK